LGIAFPNDFRGTLGWGAFLAAQLQSVALVNQNEARDAEGLAPFGDSPQFKFPIIKGMRRYQSREVDPKKPPELAV